MAHPHMSRHTGIFDAEIAYPSACVWEDEDADGAECGNPTTGDYFCTHHENPEHPDYDSQHERADIRFNPDADPL